MILDDRKYIAKKIKEYRTLRGMTQAELAEKIDISTKQISRIEVGDFYPSLISFLRIVEVLNIDLNNFVNNTPSPEDKTKNRLIRMIYDSSKEEIDFYDRLLTFVNDEVAEVKKNIIMKKI
jgi:transcriptional regulator with XRE-family HTH domain